MFNRLSFYEVVWLAFTSSLKLTIIINDNQYHSQLQNILGNSKNMSHTIISPLRYLIMIALTTPSFTFAKSLSEKSDQNQQEDVVKVIGTNSLLKISTSLAETPRSLSELTEADLQDRDIKKIDEALRYTAGILATPYGTDNKSEWLKIRGFEWSSYQNGLKTLKENGFYNWIQEPFGIERIEILKGPSSMLYGQNPPGGLVNTVIKKPQAKQQGQVAVSYGSDSYRSFGFDTTGTLTDDKRVLYRLVGFTDANAGPSQGAHKEHYYLAPSVTFMPSFDTELTVQASFAKDNTNPTSGFKTPYGTLHDTPFGKIDRKASLSEPDYTKNNTQQFSLGYEFKHNLNDIWAFQQSVNYSYLDLFLRNVYVMGMIDDRQASRGVTYRNGSAQSWSVDNRLTGYWDLDRSDNTLLLGMDYFNANSRGEDANYYGFSPIDIFHPQHGQYEPIPQSAIFSHQTHREQYGMYVQNQFKYDMHWLFLLGMRFDYAITRDQQTQDQIKLTDAKLSKTAGVMYLADNGFSPYVSYSESFSPEVGRDGYGTPYKPTEGKQIELGIKYSPDDFNGYINAAVYQLHQKNTLTSDPVTFISTQTGESRARGFEFEYAHQLTPELKLLANYTYSDVEFVKSRNSEEVGKHLPLIPKNSLSLWVDYNLEHKIEGLTVGGGMRYIGSTYGDKTNSAEMKVPSYTVFDVMARYQLNSQWQLQFNVNNIMNKKYVSACDYWCYYGEGRTLTAKLQYLW